MGIHVRLPYFFGKMKDGSPHYSQFSISMITVSLTKTSFKTAQTICHIYLKVVNKGKLDLLSILFHWILTHTIVKLLNKKKKNGSPSFWKLQGKGIWNQKLAYFVCNFKIINRVLRSDISILKQFVWETKNDITISVHE